MSDDLLTTYGSAIITVLDLLDAVDLLAVKAETALSAEPKSGPDLA